MILRRLAKAIKQQDWFVVFIELLIVVFGVYIGIYLGDAQSARQHAIETDQALAALESELRSDIVRLDEVISIQTDRIREQQELIRLWGSEDSDGEEISIILTTVLSDNSTLFPNKSAYEAMQAGGYLAALPNETLRLSITRLFEREYARQEMNAIYYDELSFDFANMILASNWDRVNHHLLGDHALALARLRNGIITVHDQGQFYFSFITEQVRPDILNVLGMIDDYQDGRNR